MKLKNESKVLVYVNGIRLPRRLWGLFMVDQGDIDSTLESGAVSYEPLIDPVLLSMERKTCS